MKILLGAWPAYGHLLPMLPMLRAAQRAGHEVVVTSGAGMAATISELGVRAHRSGVTLADSYARLPDGATIGALPPEEQAVFAAQHLFGAGAVDRALDVIDLLETWRPDLIVHDTLELGTPAAAVARAVPHVTHGYGPNVPDTPRLAAALGTTLAAADLPDPTAAVFDAPYLELCLPSLRGAEPHPWTQVQPLRPSPGELQPDAPAPTVFDGLPHQDTVYVTLGTVMNQVPEVSRTVIDGCLRHPVNVVVTTGSDFDAAQLGPLPPAVRLTAFLPQAAVLPRCRVVVSHAGAGTMLGALCHGLPQLCLPQGTDQPFNTAALLRPAPAWPSSPTRSPPTPSPSDSGGCSTSRASVRPPAGACRDQADATAPVVLDELLASLSR